MRICFWKHFKSFFSVCQTHMYRRMNHNVRYNIPYPYTFCPGFMARIFCNTAEKAVLL